MDELILRLLSDGATPAEERAVHAWRKASPANERHYGELVRLAKAARLLQDELHTVPVPDPSSILARIDERIITQRGSRAQHRRGAVLVTAGVAAALAILALGVSEIRDALRGGDLGNVELVTGRDETMTATLGDGSAVRLAPETRLRVIPTVDTREVWLEGRAYFSVTKQEDRQIGRAHV